MIEAIEMVLITTLNEFPPLLLAGLGGMISFKSGVLNLGLEGMMLLGAFAAIVTNFFTGSAVLGLIVAMLFCSLCGFIFALFNIRFKVSNVVMSVGVNLFAVSATKYLLSAIFNASGAFTSDRIVKIPTLSMPFLSNIPIVNVFSNQSIVFWIGILITLALGFVMKRTKWGLWVRATGLNDVAVTTAGINPSKVRYICITLSGTFCGIAGAYLSTSYLSMFTIGMTAGRGFLGNIASVMGNRTAFGSFLGALLFSLTDGLTMKIQTFGFPSQLIQIIPYMVAFLVMILTSLKKSKKAP